MLFDAILYSNSIGSTLNPTIKNAVDSLRNVRNRIMHADKARLTDADFQTIVSDVENSFKALGLQLMVLQALKARGTYTNPLKFYHQSQLMKLLSDLR